MASFWCLYYQFWTYLTSFCSLSIVNFDHVIAGWVVLPFLHSHWNKCLKVYINVSGCIESGCCDKWNIKVIEQPFYVCMDVWKSVFSATRRVIDFLPAGTATLWQRCLNVVVDVDTTLWHGRKWELYRRQFPTLWQRRSPTLSRRCYNVATTLSIGLVLGHFTMDYSDFFPFTETWKLQKC